MITDEKLDGHDAKLGLEAYIQAKFYANVMT